MTIVMEQFVYHMVSKDTFDTYIIYITILLKKDGKSSRPLSSYYFFILFITNPKTFLTSGPAKKICQQRAIGKLSAVV